MVWQDASHINAVFCTKTVVNTIAPTFCLGSGFFSPACALRLPPARIAQNAKSLFALCVVDGMACTARAAAAVPPELLCLETLEEMQVSEMSPKLSELAYAEGSTQRFNACGSPKEALAQFSHVAVVARALYDGSPNPLLLGAVLGHPAPPSQSTRSWCVHLYTLPCARRASAMRVPRICLSLWMMACGTCICAGLLRHHHAHDQPAQPQGQGQDGSARVPCSRTWVSTTATTTRAITSPQSTPTSTRRSSK